MNRKSEKIFSSSRLMVICGILTVILYIAADLPYCFVKGYEYDRLTILIDLLPTAMIIGLLIAFKKGATNIQKTLIGGIIYASLAGVFENLVGCLSFLVAGETGPALTDSIIFNAIFTLAIMGLFIGHIILQSEHSGSMGAIKLIEICIAVLIISDIVDIILNAVAGMDLYSTYLLGNIGFDVRCIMILCIETKIQLYKRLRKEGMDNNTWNNETKAEAKKIFQL